MSTRRAWSFLFLVFLASALVTGLAGVRMSSQDEPLEQETTIIPGRNVNMVSGTQLPGGDPWLQRQNEPSMAVSTRNPLHLLAGANDYRTVDMAMSEGGLPGKAQGAMAGDAWVGIYKSFDGGESWVTSLIPGFPQDQSAEGLASPLKQFSTAADPIVRAGTNGLFYYSGMAFNRDETKGGGSIFLARFIDNNNVEDLTQGDPIKYLDTRMIDVGNAGQFIDMPRIAADIPRGTGTITIDGQTIPRGNVYCAYTVFLGNTDINIRSRLLFRRSTDCGATWDSAVKISESQHIIQGATFAIDPRNGTIYIAFRRFLHPSQTDSIVIVRSTDFGQSFSSPFVIANINPFDQPATDLLGDDLVDPAGPSFRTNSYPTMAVDGGGIVYVAWTERGRGPTGEARIVMSTAQDGFGWTAPTPIADTGGPNYQGHQFMPSLAFSQGKLVLVWYDQRCDEYAPLFGVGPWIGDGMPVRHTTDVRCAQASPGLVPAFEASVQVSKYLWALLPGTDDALEQQQFNPPNFELFRGGTTPFQGDYIEVAAAPAFVNGANGWEYNIAPSPSPIFHAVWTDNRDVRPPLDGDWTHYTPPASAQGVFGTKDCGSVNLDSMGMRNQNIYTSALVGGVAAASPGNSKTLGDLDTYYDPEDGLIPRAFVIYVQNPGQDIKVFRLAIDPEPMDVDASFLEFEDLETLDVMIAPFSTIARTVFVRAPETYAAVTLSVVEIDDLDGEPVPDGLTASVTLNPDPTSPVYAPPDEYHNPNIRNMEIVSWTELNNNLANPNIRNPNIRNWDEMNSSLVNPNIRNIDIDNPNIRNMVVNPNIRNPNIRNWNIVNPNIRNPNIRNYTEPEFAEAEISDAVFNIKNDGNTTSTYTLKTYSKEALPDEVYAQLLVYRVHYTPSADYYKQTDVECELKVERHHELLLNVTNPNIRNPNCANPNIRNPNIRNGGLENATFAVPPGEEVEAILRVIDFAPDSQDEMRIMQTGEVFSAQAFVESIGFAATAHAYNTDEARTTPKEDLSPKTTATKLVISTSSLPYGIVNMPYEAELAADGGDVYVWTLNSGELPPGLALGTSGLIYGTPMTAGLYPFIVRVDSGGDFDTQRFSIYIDADATADPLTITTTSLPSGVLQKWYGATLEATGGVWPLTWSLYSGRLPMGLSLDSSGVISGNIEAEPEDYPRTFNFEVVVTDGTGYSSAPRALGIVVNLWTGTYMTISGVVYSSGGTPLDGVVMRGLPNTPITGMNGVPGYYEDEVPYLWSGTVIPFYAGETFTPASRTYTVIAADMSNQDYNVGAVPAFPEIDVVQNETPIPDGGVFDFGECAVGTDIDVLLTIENSGTGDLTITIPLNITGPDEDQFTIETQPTSPVLSGESTTIELRFSPTSEGAKEVKIAIENNDIDKNPYNFSLTGTGTAAAPFAAWARSYGGSDFDWAFSIQQTADSGHIVAGVMAGDVLVLKLDADGGVVWQKTYGGTMDDNASSVQQTADGGYIVAGETSSFGLGARDIWVLKLDSTGYVDWQKTYGGTDSDSAQSIRQTADGGYIMAGWTSSYGAGLVDVWVLKLDSLGNVIWQKTYGGTGADGVDYGPQSIQQTADAGYIVVGTTDSFGAGNDDVWVLKLDSSGDVVWQKTYGSGGIDSEHSIQQTSDGGYIVAGAHAGDAWALKLDALGDISWQKKYNSTEEDYAHSIQQTSDGGYIVAGTSYSFGAGNGDVWVLKLDSSGDIVWQKTYGDTSQDLARSIQQTADGGYIVTGWTYSFGSGNGDIWVLKLKPDGSIDASCLSGLGADSTAIPDSTSVTPSASSVTAIDSAAGMTETTVTPIDSAATVQTQCQSAYLPSSQTLILSTFDEDTPDEPPSTGGENQPTSLTVPPGGSILVRSSVNGIATQPLEVNDGGGGGGGWAQYDLASPITSGKVYVEATISMNQVTNSILLQTVEGGSSTVVTRIATIGNAIYAYGTNIGTYSANSPFRVREIIDMDTKTRAVAVDDELNGFSDDPVFESIPFTNNPDLISSVGQIYICVIVYNATPLDPMSVAYDNLHVYIK